MTGCDYHIHGDGRPDPKCEACTIARLRELLKHPVNQYRDARARAINGHMTLHDGLEQWYRDALDALGEEE